MKGSYKNRIPAVVSQFIIPFLFIALYGCGGLKQEKDVAKKYTGEPILLSRDAYYPLWCGNDALIYILDESTHERYVEEEVYRYDIHTGRRFLVGKGSEDVYIAPMACTPDGKWLVYLNKGSIRHGVLDIWRYETSTGRHEKIAIAHDVVGFDEGILSPDGKKLFLGKKPDVDIEMPEPKLEIVWSGIGIKNEPSGAVWLPDSSAVITSITSYWGRRDRNDDIVIEVLNPQRKTVIFKPDELSSLNLLFSDKQGRIYLYFWDSNGKEHISRCNVAPEEKAISCEDVIVEKDHEVLEFDLFSDNETVAFTKDDDTCVKAMRIGEKKPYCITPPIDKLGHYIFTHKGNIKISPDDKRLAFVLSRLDDAGEWISEDLYMIELKKD